MQDWIAFAFGVIGLLTGLLQYLKPKLPKWVQPYLKKLTTEEIIDAVSWAQTHANTPEARKQSAIEYLQQIAVQRLGVRVPDSIMNLLIEWGLQLYKKARS